MPKAIVFGTALPGGPVEVLFPCQLLIPCQMLIAFGTAFPPFFRCHPRLFWQDGAQHHRFVSRNCCTLNVTGQFLGILREKQGENAQKPLWKKPLAAVLWFCGLVEIL
jgi:hypothetical protein